MKVVVVSDSHGRIEVLQQILDDHRDASAFIHCGDIELPNDYFNEYIKVRGNNDYYGGLEEERVVRVGGLNILVTHSHQYVYYSRLESLAKKADRFGCQLVCFGHTHVYHDSVVDNVHLLNPGSCWHNRDGRMPSYAVVNFENGEISVERLEVK